MDVARVTPSKHVTAGTPRKANRDATEDKVRRLRGASPPEGTVLVRITHGVNAARDNDSDSYRVTGEARTRPTTVTANARSLRLLATSAATTVITAAR